MTGILEQLIQQAQQDGASDVHLEPGLPAALRTQTGLKMVGEPVPGAQLMAAARELCGEDGWRAFLARRSHDLTRVIARTRCRINVLQTARGVGLAIRILHGFRQSLEELNLHPDLRRLFLEGGATPQPARNGLVLVSGPTGSGKSTTMAAFVKELSERASLHIISVEQPIEYHHRSGRSLVRQREVGRDTPSFEQALVDAMREDPDVIVVGEMRTPEVMQLTLNAAETGHLVFATLHSSSTAEALARLVGSFPPETQASVAAALADCLRGVVSQRFTLLPGRDVRVPECEILVATSGVKGLIRSRDVFKTISMLETGRADGMWTFARYRRWLEALPTLAKPRLVSEAEEPNPAPPEPTGLSPLRAQTGPSAPGDVVAIAPHQVDADGSLELSGDEGDQIDDLIQQLNRRG